MFLLRSTQRIARDSPLRAAGSSGLLDGHTPAAGVPATPVIGRAASGTPWGLRRNRIDPHPQPEHRDLDHDDDDRQADCEAEDPAQVDLVFCTPPPGVARAQRVVECVSAMA
jgi:hypothetical protein